MLLIFFLQTAVIFNPRFWTRVTFIGLFNVLCMADATTFGTRVTFIGLFNGLCMDDVTTFGTRVAFIGLFKWAMHG